MIRKFLLIGAILAMGSIVKAQCKFDVLIDNKRYVASEEILNNTFGKAFERLKDNRIVKDKDYEVWMGAYYIYKNMSCQGTFSWKIFYKKIGDLGYNGEASKRDRGWDENGNAAKGNPNKIANLGSRMARLNHVMAVELTNYFLNTTLE